MSMKNPGQRFSISIACSLIFACAANAQQAAPQCGPLTNAYGPFDARRDLDKLDIVLGAHFTPVVESLTRGTTSTTPGGDIDYTLRAIPNHPRVLLAMIKLGVKEKTEKPRGSRYTVDCWLERAVRFRPDDNLARMIYANYLTDSKRKADALLQLDAVKKQVGDNPFTYYNLGLLYVDLGEYEMALEQAYLAYAQGVQQPGLRERLKAAGKWREESDENTEQAPQPAAETTPSKSDSARQ